MTEEGKLTPDEVRSQRRAGLKLLAVFVGGLLLAAAFGYLATVLIVLAVIVMVMIHELGHFVAAKAFGMKVTEFFVGFGPRLWSVKRGETEYGIKAIPAGGYNRIVGMSNLEEVDPADEPRAYRQKKFLQKVIVAGAGSFMHAVMAFLLLFSIYTVTGVTEPSTSIAVLPDGPNGQQSPAQAGGLMINDRVVGVDGRPIQAWDEVRRYIQDHPGQTITFNVERNGARLDLPVTPGVQAGSPSSAPVGFIGVGPGAVTVKTPAGEAVGKTFASLGEFSVQTVQSIGRIFSPTGLQSYTNQLATSLQPAPVGPPSEASQDRFLSPVGLVGVANDAAESGWRSTLLLLFSINIFVGIFNLVPLLPFDGGHIAVATYERLRSWRGRRHMADYNKLLPVSYAVLFFLILMSATSLWLDIVRPLPNPF